MCARAFGVKANGETVCTTSRIFRAFCHPFYTVYNSVVVAAVAIRPSNPEMYSDANCISCKLDKAMGHRAICLWRINLLQSPPTSSN